MTLDDLRAAHPKWTAEQVGWDLKVNGPDGAGRFLAEDADDADVEIHKREPGTGRCCSQNPAG